MLKNRKILIPFTILHSFKLHFKPHSAFLCKSRTLDHFFVFRLILSITRSFKGCLILHFGIFNNFTQKIYKKLYF